MQVKNKLVKIIFITLTVVSLFFFYNKEGNDSILEINFIDVGQGDGILIKTPQGKVIVIDGGPYDDFNKKIGEKLPYRKRNIDLLILTHPHQDHYVGLVNLVKNYDVNTFIYPNYDIFLDDYKYLMKLIKEKNTKIIVGRFGQNINIENDFNLKILYPINIKKNEKNLNDTSVVVKLSYKKFDTLFTGDLPCEGEDEILKRQVDINSELLKIGHHGSRYSTCDEFLNKVGPIISVIQVGKDNDFKHPHIETLKKLSDKYVKILKNDELGDITIRSDGLDYWYKTDQKEHHFKAL